MSCRSSAFLVLSVLVAVTEIAAQRDRERVVADDARARSIAALVEASAALGMSGAALAAKDGEVLFAGGVGHADLEDEVPNTATTLFEIASATKQFTGAAVCRLVEMRRLKLDDSIAEHLPGVPENCAAITVRHLLQHTSGIPSTNSRGGGRDLAAVLPLFLEGGPRHPPGTHWEYWNQGYALAAAIIERASGDAFTDFCSREVFRRAKLRVTCFTGDAAPRGATVAVGRSTRGEPRTALEHPYGEYGYQYLGMGGAVTNVWDLWRWDRALHGTKVLGERTKRELFTPGPGDYALGWFVRRQEDRLVHEHGGSVRGFVCSVRRYPDDDAALFVLCNRDDAPVYGIVAMLERALFDAAPEVPRALPDGVASAWLGDYRDAGGSTLTVARSGAAVSVELKWPGGQVTRGHLVQGAEDGTVALFDWSATTRLGDVTTGEDGRVTAFSLGAQRFTR